MSDLSKNPWKLWFSRTDNHYQNWQGNLFSMWTLSFFLLLLTTDRMTFKKFLQHFFRRATFPSITDISTLACYANRDPLVWTFLLSLLTSGQYLLWQYIFCQNQEKLQVKWQQQHEGPWIHFKQSCSHTKSMTFVPACLGYIEK